MGDRTSARPAKSYSAQSLLIHTQSCFHNCIHTVYVQIKTMQLVCLIFSFTTLIIRHAILWNSVEKRTKKSNYYSNHGYMHFGIQ